jgi:hypothetical protein
MSTQYSYFKFRSRFELFPHRYDIGWPIFTDKIFGLNFFVDKIYKIRKDEYALFYNHQLNHYLEGNAGQEEAFFNHVYDIIKNRIKYYKGLRPSGSTYAKGLIFTAKLEVFLAFLKSIDQWHKVEPLESVIGEKDKLIAQLKARIEKLEAQLKQAKDFNANEKVVITNGYIATFMDLVHQFQNLTLGQTKLLSSQGQSPWYKMIAKYFQHGVNEIPIDTAHNYFAPRNKPKPPKYIEIAEEDKLFEIVLKNKK